jgi:hypothetical protein
MMIHKDMVSIMEKYYFGRIIQGDNNNVVDNVYIQDDEERKMIVLNVRGGHIVLDLISFLEKYKEAEKEYENE